MLKRRQRQIYPVGLWHKKTFFVTLFVLLSIQLLEV
jgi:hypothetical protein